MFTSPSLSRRCNSRAPWLLESGAAGEGPAPDEELAALRARLRALHESLVERAFLLDRRGRTDASDELNAATEELRRLLD